MRDLSGLLGAAVLTVGDVMIDEYVWGEVRRISPEAPVPVVEVRRRDVAAGGAGNVAAGVAAIGGRALLVGVVGEDREAESLRGALAAAGVDGEGLVVDARRPTTTKTRVIAHSQQVVRTDHEDTSTLSAEIEAELVERSRERVREVDAVVLSDYRKGVISEAVAQGVLQAASAEGKPVIVDPKGLDYRRYRGATVITPNVHDAGQAANVHIDSDADLLKAVGRLMDGTDGAALLVTRGAAGMALFTGDSRIDVPTVARDVYDVTGAGDTVVVLLAVALGRGWPLPDAVRLANAAAGIVVGKIGTSTVTLEELERSLGG